MAAVTIDSETYTVIKKLDEGISGDEKYKLENNGKFFLLRVSNIDKLSEKRSEYNRLKKYEKTEINTHKQIALGIAQDKCYSVVSWVNGTPVMDIIKQDITKDYYRLGKAVGYELLKLHLASQAETDINWYTVIKKNAEQFLDHYHHLQVEFAGSRFAEKYILENLNCTVNRPMVMLHGDFHWVNCVVDENNRVGIIDFSGNEIGDPWYEFGGVLWALEYSGSFVNGQIDGYFGTPPDEFWKVFKLYAALYAFEHLTYGDNFPEDIQHKIKHASRMSSIFGETYHFDLPDFRRYKMQ